jgi:formyltetrahydrofolate-dependent phosphoribosylglycinamide formyltransferase
MPPGPLKLAVLLSGSGTTLQNLVDEIAARRLDAEVCVVIGSRPGLKGLERAAAARLPNFVVDRREFDDTASFSKEVFSLCDDAGVELLCMAGWLCLLDVPQRYLGRAMNIHPALLPSFGGKGMYGAKVHRAVIEQGCKVSGCTVHFADNTYDTGPIILQRTCVVAEDDTPETLAQRVFEEEKVAYPQAIRMFQRGRLRIEGRRVRVLAGAQAGAAGDAV